MHPIVRFWHQLSSPEYFYRFAGSALHWLVLPCAGCFAVGIYAGLVLAPPDYQQGDSVRIMYIHVPAAWMSLFIYVVMAIAGILAVVWRTKIAEWTAIACAPVGAMFTAVTLITGSLWGRPTWGTYWAWDARLTAELVLLFLYLGVIALYHAIDDRRQAARAASLLAIVGLVNIPIIHFSVKWWNTLHQGSSIRLTGDNSIHDSMLWPLLIMALATKLYFVISLLNRIRVQILEAEAGKQWVQALEHRHG
jgi:heme exporter protein C